MRIKYEETNKNCQAMTEISELSYRNEAQTGNNNTMYSNMYSLVQIDVKKMSLCHKFKV